jgi:hypothetical protein
LPDRQIEFVLPNRNAKSKCQIDLANHLGKSRSGKMVCQIYLPFRQI